MRLFLLTILFVACATAAFGQTNDCYEGLLQKGKDFYNAGTFDKALIKWTGALECPDLTNGQIQTLNDWIAKVKNPPKSCYEPLFYEGVEIYNEGNYEGAKQKWSNALNCSNLTDWQRQWLNDWIKKAENQSAVKIVTSPTKEMPPSVVKTKQANQPYEPEMVFVEGGTFQMVSDNRLSDKKPTHAVTVSNFYIGKYEVTKKEWRDVMGNNPTYFTGCDDCPVVYVSWDDIQEYLTKLNANTGKKYRLPTEAEWEFAARGGNKSKGYEYSGSNTVGDVAWYDDNSGNLFKKNQKTHPVGKKQANELGLYDMSGNVWEWCSDWDGSYNSSAVSNPTGAVTGTYRVFRGGSWDNLASSCRSAYQISNMPTYKSGSLGFRVVLIL